MSKSIGLKSLKILIPILSALVIAFGGVSPIIVILIAAIFGIIYGKAKEGK